MKPDVSVILPVFNRLEFLKLAIQSVFAQTHPSWEIVIADDGSDPQTQTYLHSISGPRVHVIWLPHCGNPSRVRNAAIAGARGRYLAFLDSDDIWAPSKLQKQIEALRARPECRWSYTACDRIDHQGQPLGGTGKIPTPRGGWIFEPLLRLEVAIAMPTVVAERDLVNAIGGFDEEQLFGEFQDLCLRLALESEATAVSEPLCSVRAHQEHYSADRMAAHASWIRLYRKMEALSANPATRAFCGRKRMETSLRLARMQRAKGEYRAALGTLGIGLKFSWRHPQWWVGALKGLARRQ